MAGAPDLHIIMNQYKECILATEREATEWLDFQIFEHEDGSITTEEKLQLLREKGFKIFIVPYENRIYDDISKTIQYFDEQGRGEVIARY